MAGCVGPVERHSRGVNFHDLQDSTPNQALERTATRRTLHFLMIKTVSVAVELGDGGGRSACFR